MDEIKIQIDNKVIELTEQEKEAFFADQVIRQESAMGIEKIKAQAEAEEAAKQQAFNDAVSAAVAAAFAAQQTPTE